MDSAGDRLTPIEAGAADEGRQSRQPLMQVGRYVLFNEIASGGFASVHLGRTVGVAGFSRVVAIKRLHRQFAKDPEASAMFLDEAKVVARIRHHNVVPTLDLIAEDDELFLVMEYVEGCTLKYLLQQAKRRRRRVPLGVVLRVIVGALHGLEAAHEARDPSGELLQLVHRDVSPDNILVGVDGMPRLLDFGVARAINRFGNTRDGEVKGKLAYISPDQVKGDPITRRTDIFSASAVLWEAMTGRRLFKAKSIAAMAHAVISSTIDAPSTIADTPKKLDGIVMQGLERDAERRWSSAHKMATALEAVGELASQHAVGRYVRQVAAEQLKKRNEEVAMVEAFPIANLQPLPMRSKLDSLGHQLPTDEESTVGGSVDESGALVSGDEASAGGTTETPIDLNVRPDSTEKRRWLPYAAGAAGLVVIIALQLALTGSETKPAPADPIPVRTTSAAAAALPTTEPTAEPTTEPSADPVNADDPNGDASATTSADAAPEESAKPNVKRRRRGGGVRRPPPPPATLYGRE